MRYSRVSCLQFDQVAISARFIIGKINGKIVHENKTVVFNSLSSL